MHVSINHSCTRLTVGSTDGLQVYQVGGASAATVSRISQESFMGSIALVAIEESSGTIVAVLDDPSSPHSSHRRVLLCDPKSGEILSELQFEDRILNIQVNSVCLVVILEHRTHFLDWETLTPMPQLVTVNPPNSKGLGSLSGAKQSRKGNIAYFAGSHTDLNQSRGDIVLLELPSNRLMVLGAHNSNQIAAIEMSGDGSCVATASTKGTIIRVFRIPTGEMLHNFRRGKSDVVVESLTFSPNNFFLAVASSSSTLHVFRCDPAESTQKELPSFAKIPVKERTKYTIGLSDQDGEGQFTVWTVAKPSASVVEGADPTQVSKKGGKLELAVEAFRVETATGNFKRIAESKGGHKISYPLNKVPTLGF